MTYQEAKEYMTRILENRKPPKLDARLVRILPLDLDPIQEGDTGWDVEITVLEDW